MIESGGQEYIVVRLMEKHVDSGDYLPTFSTTQGGPVRSRSSLPGSSDQDSKHRNGNYQPVAIADVLLCTCVRRARRTEYLTWKNPSARHFDWLLDLRRTLTFSQFEI
jgi:hypothetical protein